MRESMAKSRERGTGSGFFETYRVEDAHTSEWREPPKR
jgi:hypothetical protein